MEKRTGSAAPHAAIEIAAKVRMIASFARSIQKEFHASPPRKSKVVRLTYKRSSESIRLKVVQNDAGTEFRQGSRHILLAAATARPTQRRIASRTARRSAVQSQKCLETNYRRSSSFRSASFDILPVFPIGSDSRNSTYRGYLFAANCFLHQSMKAASES